MSKKRAREMASEVYAFWTASSELRRLRRDEPNSPLIAEYHEELSVIARFTDWPRLKTSISNPYKVIKAHSSVLGILCVACLA